MDFSKKYWYQKTRHKISHNPVYLYNPPLVVDFRRKSIGGHATHHPVICKQLQVAFIYMTNSDAKFNQSWKFYNKYFDLNITKMLLVIHIISKTALHFINFVKKIWRLFSVIFALSCICKEYPQFTLLWISRPWLGNVVCF